MSVPGPSSYELIPGENKFDQKQRNATSQKNFDCTTTRF